METRANYILIGAFMVATLIGAFGFVYWLAVTAESRQNVEVKILYPGPVTGLPVGGQVLFNGIRVGDVKSLDFAPGDPTKVVATVGIRPSTPLREDTKATLNFTGLTGVAYVDLSGGTSDSPLLLGQNNGKIPVIEADRSFFDDIVDGARDVLKRADSTMKTVDDLLKENSPAIAQTIQNVETFSGALASNSDGVEDFMASIGRASDAFSSLSGRMEGLVEEGERLLAAVPSDKVTLIVDDLSKFSESLGKAGDDIDLLMSDAQSAAQELEDFTKRLNEGFGHVQGIVQAVKPEDIEKVMAGAASLGALLEERTDDIDRLIVSTSETMQNVNEIVSIVQEREGAITDILEGSRDVVLKVDGIVTRGVEIAAAIDPLQIEGVVNSVSAFAEGLNLSLERVDAIVDSVDPDKVGQAVDGVTAVIDNINNQQSQINEIIASTKSTVQNFEAVSATVRGQDDRIAALITDVQAAAERFAATLGTADDLLQAIDPARVANIVGSVETAAAGLSNPEDGIPAILQSARTAADNVQQMTEDLSKRTPDVDQIITDAKQMTATLNSTSVRVESLIEKVSEMVDGDGEGLIKEATLAAQAIRKVAVAFESRADSIAGGLSKFATQGSADFASALAQVNRTLVSIQRAAESFERSPNRVIFGGEDVPTYNGARRR
ncbi:MCE family protein [Roseibium denhamense]|uniref:Phospholipid/cholesterol/gamma-HCH transport system substrate-binding protein n=1 Tax=Roseibium denhamense TaxID=76305 RepID=A0ABY1N920_9HYPH|nr:MlaD family protein [Roseibium denhamense]MTI05628.1 MCE family protein [Roseibium denhamense]SMP03339.1 phospholipid/cholesterol/gamma-HCH transport system substrate-binding protein [Roseibium denhamense]